MITPDSPDRVYSTRLRTALVFTGSGTAGAYHAGVLRALQEAGVRIDLVAGRGVGVVGACFAAIDGGLRLWDADGIWRSEATRRFYGWRLPLRVAGWTLLAAGAILLIPAVFLVLGAVSAIVGLLLTLVGLQRAAAVFTTGYGHWLEAIFAPDALPTIVPRLVLLAVLVAAVTAAVAAIRTSRRSQRRRSTLDIAGRALAGPLTPASFVQRVTTELWNLIRGAAPIAPPPARDLGRRYLDLLIENLGQPGFRELLLVVHDMDARRDLVFALLNPRVRPRFFTKAGPSESSARQLEAFDLAGAARDHAFDALHAALALPVAVDPALVTFAAEGGWRGETHRTCDRPASLVRLLEEVALAGAEQVILAAASPPGARAHELSTGRADLRGRAGEQLAAFEAASLRDALEHFTGRFAGLFVIHPAHNPLGPLDFDGVYDERSDRTHRLAELIDQGYEDAYRQFIDPVVGASGEKIATVSR